MTVKDSSPSFSFPHEINQTGDLGLKHSMAKLKIGEMRKSPIAILQGRLAPNKTIIFLKEGLCVLK